MSFPKQSYEQIIFSIVDAYKDKYPDVQDRANLLRLSQFKESQNLKNYIACLLAVFEDILQAAKEVVTLRFVDTAYGKQLDTVGEIIGQNRRLLGTKPLGYFGYYENPQAHDPSVGDDRDPTLGGIFKGDFDPDSTDFILTDQEYLKAIYAKILKNVSNTTTDDVITYVNLILNKEVDLEIIESQSINACHLKFHLKLSVTDRALVAALIKNMKVGGVRYTMEDDSGDIEINSDGPNIIH